MAEVIRNDLKMIGESTSAGGRFRNVSVIGECVLTGEVDCVKLSCTGEMIVNGSLKTEELKLTGECAVKGQLDAGTVRGRGEIEVSSGLRGENIKFTGNINVQGDCEMGTFEMFGGFDVKGLLSADWLEIKMYGPCQAREIGGAKLRVKRSKPAVLLRLIKPISAAVLSTDLIEGDAVHLEFTTSGIVRGNSVIIGPGCKIERVEYRDTLVVHKSAIVKERIKL